MPYLQPPRPQTPRRRRSNSRPRTPPRQWIPVQGSSERDLVSSSVEASPPPSAGTSRNTPLQLRTPASTTLHSARNTSTPSATDCFLPRYDSCSSLLQKD